MKNKLRILLSVLFVVGLASIANAQCQRVRLKVALSGAAVNGVTPKGAAEFRQREDCSRSLTVDVDNVNLPDGTLLNVYVDNATNFVGSISLNLQGGSLIVPGATRPAAVLITDATGKMILSGNF